MARTDTDGLEWFKSSYSAGDGGQCVEVAARPARVHVRDSKDTTRAALAVEPTAWTAFVEFAAL
ncbi:DUF397 domain-containing protein [Streptomyces sp. WI04-05B]|uniref:DUF397 domain-containing protein n=1 Tax=Streptomyces TaxID=1883 RepID=UPI0029AE7EC6|nr:MULTISPECIES: DUF397 domain-containing protein [unclassified Streptomyces]MDX2544373.1 DUF397 domain-containing protein [Streptomyces sp. WI04-05B]MDX2588558.1 DUF397 domain-containing protein [Streptomyces sp. WI04-05A]